MNAAEPVVIEMFYTLTCPNCRVMKRMLSEVLPEFGQKFRLETTMASLPKGMFRSLKLGIHTVPTVLIDGRIVFKEVPSKMELIDKLNTY